MKNQYVAEEAEIRKQTENWAQSVRASDFEGITRYYSQDIVAFDAVKQLQFIGREDYIKHWEYCLTLCDHSGMVFEIKDLVVHTEKEIAFTYFLNRCGGKDENGDEKSSWMRVTRGHRKVEGNWLTVHEHFSSPFDMESGKALFDLQP